MTNHIGELIMQQRELKDLKRSKLASMVGYTNLSKGCRKITELERDGINRPDLLKKLIKALEISKEDLQEAHRKENADFENCLNGPMKMIVTGGSMKFELNEEEVKRYDRWKKEHDKNCPYLYTGAAGGRMSFCFSPNSLGMTEKIVRCACGAFKHLSDSGDD